MGRDETPKDRHVNARAAKLQVDESDDPLLSDKEKAERAARRILEDSEARTEQARDLDPDDDDVIRRSSEETAEHPE